MDERFPFTWLCVRILLIYLGVIMHHVTFIINQDRPDLSRVDFLCTLLQSCLDHGGAPFCYVDDAAYAEFLSDYLWNNHLFLPNHIGRYHAQFAQITISDNLDDAIDCPSIFNCSHQALIDIPANSASETIEWVCDDPDEKAHMRNLFRSYKEHQRTIHTVRI